MRKMIVAGFVLGVAGVLAQPAGAQVKGAGKLGITIMAIDAVTGQGTANAKAAGAYAVKPLATLAGKPPSGGALSSFKLAKDLGDPLKPGFAPGSYVIEFETAQTSGGDAAGPSGIATFATLTVDSLGKCTIDPHASVLTGSGSCGGIGQPLCADPAVGKCTITTYQIAGTTNYLLAPGTAQPTAQRVRIRKLGNATDCKTGDVIVGGTPLIGGTTCHDPLNPVIGVVGVANGEID